MSDSLSHLKAICQQATEFFFADWKSVAGSLYLFIYFCKTIHERLWFTEPYRNNSLILILRDDEDNFTKIWKIVFKKKSAYHNFFLGKPKMSCLRGDTSSNVVIPTDCSRCKAQTRQRLPQFSAFRGSDKAGMRSERSLCVRECRRGDTAVWRWYASWDLREI